MYITGGSENGLAAIVWKNETITKWEDYKSSDCRSDDVKA